MVNFFVRGVGMTEDYSLGKAKSCWKRGDVRIHGRANRQSAAFSFLPIRGERERYIDVLDIGPDAIDTAVFPDHTATIAAFALGRLALCPAPLCPVTADRNPQ